MKSPDLTTPVAPPGEPEGAGLRHVVLILWPSFLAACLLEGLVFGMVDPGEVHWPGFFPQPSRQGVYTLAFFLFWAISVACSGLVLWLAKPVPAVNGEPFSD
jgi:hypothetical protein